MLWTKKANKIYSERTVLRKGRKKNAAWSIKNA